MPQYSPLLRAIPEYPFAKVGRLSREVEQRDGIKVINARIGIPDEEAMPTVKRHMAQYVLEPGSTFGYPVDVHPARGIPELTEAICRYYREKHGVDMKPENIAVTGWTKTVLHNLARMFGPIRGVVPEPVYPAYEGGITLAGHRVRRVPTSSQSGWLPELKFDEGYDSFFYLCDPNNPTGVVADREYFDRLLKEMEAHDVAGIFDRAYMDYVFDGNTEPVPIAQVPGLMDRGIEVVSFSKNHNFVGIGLGWVASSPENIDRWLRFEGQYGQGVPWYHQKAGVVALTDPEARGEMAEYMDKIKARRNTLVKGLNELGLQCELPRATPYVWARVPEGRGDEDFILGTLLEKAHVAFMPGSYFGESGSGHFRSTLFLPKEQIEEALSRIEKVRDW